MSLKIIITGTTGMVGEGVLMECLSNPAIEKVLALSRKPCGIEHPKLTEIIHEIFFDITALVPKVMGYDGCFFCLGISSVGMKEDAYKKITYDLTMHVATVLSEANKNEMTFCYISGASTDSTEKGRMMWARIKGKTENDLSKLPFKAVYNFRPGGLIATKGQKHILPLYKYASWLVKLIHKIAPNYASTIQELALSMIKVCQSGYAKNIVEVADIHLLAKT